MQSKAAAAAAALTPDGDANRGPKITIVTWVECGIAFALLLARIWTRLRILKSWGWDDVFICLAMVCAMVNSTLLELSVHYGTGRHIDYLSDHQVLMANKYNWISQGLHVMSTNWGKVSIALFLLRIVDRAKSQRYYFYAGMALLVIVNSASTGIIYGQCEHSSDLWAAERKGSCWDPSIHRNVAYFQGSFSALSDLVLAVYPLFVIWNLQMARRLKVIISFVMMLGIVAMGGAIVKTINLRKLATRRDYTFETALLCIYVATEQYLIIIAACIPGLGPLFKMVKTSSTRKTSGQPRYTGGPYTRSRAKVSRSGRQHLTGGSGNLKTSLSEAQPDFAGHPLHPLGEYSVNTWTSQRDDETFRGRNDSMEAIVPADGNETEQMQHGGIMRTLEVQILSDRGSEQGEDSNADIHNQKTRNNMRWQMRSADRAV